MLPAVRNLAQRHQRYGGGDRHYLIVGSALLWTLERGLGDGFTPEVRDAWAAAYKVLSDTMIAAELATA